MASLLLIEGPAGSGKSQEVARILAANEADVVADLTAQWVALRAVERRPNGRYPVRFDDDPSVSTGLAAYMRAVVVRRGLQLGLNVVVTSGSPRTAPKWAAVAQEEKASFMLRTIDPGEAAVRARLAEDGELSDQCEAAIDRWYR